MRHLLASSAFVTLAVVVVVVAGCGAGDPPSRSGADVEPVTLSATSYEPTGSIGAKTLTEFARRASALSNGAIEIEVGPIPTARGPTHPPRRSQRSARDPPTSGSSPRARSTSSECLRSRRCRLHCSSRATSSVTASSRMRSRTRCSARSTRSRSRDWPSPTQTGASHWDMARRSCRSTTTAGSRSRHGRVPQPTRRFAHWERSRPRSTAATSPRRPKPGRSSAPKVSLQ